MFQNLTTDELKSLMAALMTREHGFGSNRMARMLAGSPDAKRQRAYSDLASEIVNLHSEVANVLCDAYRTAA